MTAQGAATAAQYITQPERGHTVATRVRTTITPGVVIKVNSSELLDLERQRLIYSRELASGEEPRKGEHTWEDDRPTVVESGVITDAKAEKNRESK